MKKSVEKPNNVLEKAKNSQANNWHKKTNTYKIIAMNFVQEQLTYINISKIIFQKRLL